MSMHIPWQHVYAISLCHGRHGLILPFWSMANPMGHGMTSRKAARGRVCSLDEGGRNIDCSDAIFWPWGWTQWLGQPPIPRGDQRTFNHHSEMGVQSIQLQAQGFCSYGNSMPW